MKRSITRALLAIIAAIPLLAACGAPDLVPATTVPMTPTATTSAATPVAATVTRAVTTIPTARATAPSTPASTPIIDRPGTPRGTATATRIAQGPRYALTLGQAVAIPNSDLTIRFKGVTNDSRCPGSQFVACAWNGEATVSFEATVGTETHTILLIMPGLTEDTTLRGDSPKTHVTYKGYVIQIVSLEPQPTYTPPPIGPGTATIPTPTPSVTEQTATILVTVAP